MMELAYTVSATFDDSHTADDWLAWLRKGHIAEVLAGGAVEAAIVELDSAAPKRSFEIRYRFPSRGVFERYERDHAPRLRAEGLMRFPPERGIAYRRSTGLISDIIRG